MFFSGGLVGYNQIAGLCVQGSKYIRVKHRVIGFHRNMRRKVFIQFYKGWYPLIHGVGISYDVYGNVSVQLCENVPGCITQGKNFAGT